MPALNFTKFIDKVENGAKPCTIRAQRKVPIKKGDALYLYTGMRQAGCRRLLRKPVKCREALDIAIHAYLENGEVAYSVVLDCVRLQDEWVCKLAKLDGFPNFLSFVTFFLPNEGDLFFGQFIHWKHPARSYRPVFELLA